MYKNVQANPEKSQNDTTLLLFYVDTRKKLKSRRCNGYRFIQKGETFPTETITLVVRSSGLWEAYTQTCLKWNKKFTTACWCRAMIACKFHEFRTTFGFTRITKASTSTFAGEPRCHGVWNSYPFLEWDVSINPWTHISFYNPFWCTGACACGLILNCAPEMARKPI